jgi:pSer/pThr/pTyr-binding forkhead associated (FHA) protein
MPSNNHAGLHPEQHAGLEVVIEQLGKSVLTRSVECGELLVVGRAPDCGLCLNDPALSRKHAEIRINSKMSR